MKVTKKIGAVLCAAAVFAFAGCAKKTTTVKVGVCGASNEQWKAVQYVLDEQKAGIQIELVEFSAYNLPNEALHSGRIALLVVLCGNRRHGPAAHVVGKHLLLRPVRR